MLTLFICIDQFNGYFFGFLDILKFICILLGIFIIANKNTVISVLYLILLYGIVSIYLILVGVKFIGLSYLLVYVGAVSILFLFILMLINIRMSELISETNDIAPLAIVTNIIFVLFYFEIFPDEFTFFTQKNELILLYVPYLNWDGSLVNITDIISIGNIMYTSFSVWLIITSIIILLGMVGAIIITVKQK